MPTSTPRRRMDPATRSTLLGLLLLFAPALIPIALVLAVLVAFLVVMVVYAFAEGFAEGCAALATLIGIPSLILLWLSKVSQLLGGGRPPAPPMDETARRYSAGDFVHRDYEEERRMRE